MPIGLLSLSHLEFVKLLQHLYSCLSSNLPSFQPLFLQIFSLPISQFSFWDLTVQMLVSWWCPTEPLVSVCFWSVSFHSSNLIIYMSYLRVCRFFLLLAQVCVSEFFVSVIVLFRSRIFFGSFLGFLFLYSYFHFIQRLFSWLCPHLPLVLWASFRQLL